MSDDDRPSLTTFRAWIQRLPLPAFFLVIFALWVLLQVLFGRQDDSVHLTGDVGGGLIFATFSTVTLRIRRRRLGGAVQFSQYVAALRSGGVPAGADTSRWPAALDATERRIRRYRWLAPVLLILPIGLGMWGLTIPDARLAAALLIVVFLLAGITSEAFVPRDLRRVRRLRDALAAQPPTLEPPR